MNCPRCHNEIWLEKGTKIQYCFGYSHVVTSEDDNKQGNLNISLKQWKNKKKKPNNTKKEYVISKKTI